MVPQCFRCGACCRSYFCVVPKNENSNLSDEFLEKYEEENGYYKLERYISENSIPQGSRCKWLVQESYVVDDGKNTIASCSAYDRKSNMCGGHRKTEWCNIGLMNWKRHKDNGHVIPDQILESLEHHPLYKNIFK